MNFASKPPNGGTSRNGGTGRNGSGPNGYDHQHMNSDGHAKGWVEGYASVLVRTDQKEALRLFRENMGINVPGFERSLITAMVQMFLSRTDLHSELLKLLEDAMRRDAELQIGQLQRHYRGPSNGRPNGDGGLK